MINSKIANKILNLLLKTEQKFYALKVKRATNSLMSIKTAFFLLPLIVKDQTDIYRNLQKILLQN